MTGKADDRRQLERAIGAQEQLPGIVDDEIVDLTVASLRARLDGLGSSRRPAASSGHRCCSPTCRGSRRSPERRCGVVSDLMNDVWSRLDHIVISFGGWIDKHIGDAVMALWGAEAPNENDPEQAVRAGLELQRAWPSSTARVGHSYARRHLHGPVVLGEVATTSEFTAMGDTVNVAARLEHMAPANGVLIAHDTYRHVRGVFDVSPLDPLDVGAATKPVRAYVVLRAKTADVPDADAWESRVSRRRWSAATTSWRAATRLRRDTSGGLRGDGRRRAGVGKSRLLYEFENWVELLAQKVYSPQGARAGDTSERAVRPVPRPGRDPLRDPRQRSPRHGRRRSCVTDSRASGPDEADLVGHWLGFDLSRAERFAGCTGRLDSRRPARPTSPRTSRALAAPTSCWWCSRTSTGPTPTRWSCSPTGGRLDDSAALVVGRDPADPARGRPAVLSADATCRASTAPLGTSQPGAGRRRAATRGGSSRTAGRTHRGTGRRQPVLRRGADQDADRRRRHRPGRRAAAWRSTGPARWRPRCRRR